MKIFTSSRYDRKLKRLNAKLYAALTERLELFLREPNHPLLNDHKLTGDRKYQRSINITGDWRLVYEPVDIETIWFIDIDRHRNVYGK